MYQIRVTEENSVITIYLDKEMDTKSDALEMAAKALAREVIKNESRNKFSDGC